MDPGTRVDTPARAQAQTTAKQTPDIAGIEQFHQQDVAATLSRDPVALTSLWTDDAVRLRSGQSPELGRQAIHESNERWSALPGVTVLSYVPETKDITILDGWAVEWGYITGSYVETPGGAVKQVLGTRLMVLKKMPDGSWKCFRGMGGPTFTAPFAGHVVQVPASSAATPSADRAADVAGVDKLRQQDIGRPRQARMTVRNRLPGRGPGTEERSVTHTRIVVTHYGGPEALQVIEEERPEPARGDVRIRVQAAGVCLPDIMAREGVHPETPPVPYTPGWDLVGQVDRLGDGVSGLEPGQIVAAMPIHGAYAEFVCLPHRELVPVPSGVDAAEAVSLVLNYITAYQMLHGSAKVRPGQRALIHGAAGGVGTALLQLGRLAGLEMYGTCSSRGAAAVTDLGGIPIDYQHQDFVEEIHRLTGAGVDVVFDPIGGDHLWRSRQALRPGGRVVGYGNTTSLRGAGLGSTRAGRRNRLHGLPVYALYIVGGWLLPGRKRVIPYSIQTLKRIRPARFRRDLTALFGLLQQGSIRPLIARRFPLAEARQAQELLGKGGVIGKVVLVPSGSPA